MSLVRIVVDESSYDWVVNFLVSKGFQWHPSFDEESCLRERFPVILEINLNNKGVYYFTSTFMEGGRTDENECLLTDGGVDGLIVCTKDGWIPWTGSEDDISPIKGHFGCDVLLRNGQLNKYDARTTASAWSWYKAHSTNDIVMYRPRKLATSPDKPFITYIDVGVFK